MTTVLLTLIDSNNNTNVKNLHWRHFIWAHNVYKNVRNICIPFPLYDIFLCKWISGRCCQINKHIYIMLHQCFYCLNSKYFASSVTRVSLSQGKNAQEPFVWQRKFFVTKNTKKRDHSFLTISKKYGTQIRRGGVNKLCICYSDMYFRTKRNNWLYQIFDTRKLYTIL
jgi:hypothetical protein